VGSVSPIKQGAVSPIKQVASYMDYSYSQPSDTN